MGGKLALAPGRLILLAGKKRGKALNAESLRYKAAKRMALGAAQAKQSPQKAEAKGKQALSSSSSDGSDCGVTIAWGQAVEQGQTARRSQGLDPTRPER